ncbi:hypothetical protein QTP86_016288 [Hemibagrus guttatus]|nr:hypothetical protein QTP86_016288 [Hemibagrus guttatus]
MTVPMRSPKVHSYPDMEGVPLLLSKVKAEPPEDLLSSEHFHTQTEPVDLSINKNRSSPLSSTASPITSAFSPSSSSSSSSSSSPSVIASISSGKPSVLTPGPLVGSPSGIRGQSYLHIIHPVPPSSPSKLARQVQRIPVVVQSLPLMYTTAVRSPSNHLNSTIMVPLLDEAKSQGKGVVLKEEFVRNVLEVKRVSDRVMSLKLEIEGVMLNVVSGYAPQVGCDLEEKERFCSELDEVMESIPMGERVVIGVDFNGHVGEGNTGDEEVMGKFGVKERNLEGQMVVDFAKRMDMAVVNTYFQKREEHRVTYKSGGRRTQVDYILCRRGNLKEISDCKVVVGESVARQHRMVVRRMTLMVCKKKR